MSRMCISCATATLIVLLAAHFWDINAREFALARFLSNDREAIERIAANYGVSPGECATNHDADLHSLASAFVTVESFATSRSEGWMRMLIAHGGALVGLAPDISAGPGRIRISTARAALGYSPPSNRALARNLLTACGATEIAARILASVSQSGRAPLLIDRRFIQAATATYNGQAQQASSLQAALSAKVYFDLIYATYQHYRFATLAVGERRIAGR
jgi:hypothetical protein